MLKQVMITPANDDGHRRDAHPLTPTQPHPVPLVVGHSAYIVIPLGGRLGLLRGTLKSGGYDIGRIDDSPRLGCSVVRLRSNALS